MDDVLTRLSRVIIEDPHEPLWVDLRDELTRLRAEMHQKTRCECSVDDACGRALEIERLRKVVADAGM